VILYVTNVDTEILALRTAIIPSTVRRSLGITTAALVMLVSFTYRYYRAHPDFHPEYSPATFATMMTLFASAMVIVTVVVTRTIYGLRKKIQEAAQLGQYTLEEKIGQGGMGVVYEATQRGVGRTVALKMLINNPRESADC